MLMTPEEWKSLTPESRARIGIFVQNVEDIIRDVFGEDNPNLIEITLINLGYRPFPPEIFRNTTR